VDKFKNFLLDLLFPKFCLGCQKEGSYLCYDCRALLDISEFNYCLCDTKPIRLAPLGLRLSSAEPPQGWPNGKCDRCKDKKLSGLYFALPYNLPAGRQEKTLTKKLIYQFKYQPYLKDLAKTLANILIEHLVISKNNAEKIWENAVLVPIPIHKNKLKIRGYNQSEELAKELSKVLKIPLFSGALIKTKATKSQMELKKSEREKNLEGAFAVKPAFAPELRRGKVFLIDDVYTTGSTMEECAKILRASGVKQVWGITIAREG
jgi:ComF family protein